MDTAYAQEMPEKRSAQLLLTIPRRTLLVLCGPAGAGKSTLARTLVTSYKDVGLRDTTIVSSDYCRALICDDENNQAVNRETFELFYDIIDRRMRQNVLTIADSTALLADTRYQLLALAHKYNYFSCILVFNTSTATCIERDRQRLRNVGERVVRYHSEQMMQALQTIPREGWNRFYLVDETSRGVNLKLL